MKIFGAWKARGGCAALVVVASAAGGCAGGRGPARVGGFSRSSTLGSDLRQVPRGVTVPPPALGVDLVRGGSAPADPATGRAGLAARPGAAQPTADRPPSPSDNSLNGHERGNRSAGPNAPPP